MVGAGKMLNKDMRQDILFAFRVFKLEPSPQHARIRSCFVGTSTDWKGKAAKREEMSRWKSLATEIQEYGVAQAVDVSE